MNKLMAILQKEWLELRQQRGLVLIVLFLPLLLTVLPIVAMIVTGRVSDSDMARTGNMAQYRELLKSDPLLASMGLTELVQAFLGKEFSLLFLMIPIFIPGTVAAYSIVGEKTRHTLEPVLATPIRTWELLLAKSLAAFIPAMLLTLLFGAVFIVGVDLTALTPKVVEAVLTLGWLLLFLFCSPLFALLSILFTVIVSSRTNDPRTAQQISAVLIVPLIAAAVGQATGLIVLGPVIAVGLSVALIGACAVTLYLAEKLFRRESILTRWN